MRKAFNSVLALIVAFSLVVPSAYAEEVNLPSNTAPTQPSNAQGVTAKTEPLIGDATSTEATSPTTETEQNQPVTNSEEVKASTDTQVTEENQPQSEEGKSQEPTQTSEEPKTESTKSTEPTEPTSEVQTEEPEATTEATTEEDVSPSEEVTNYEDRTKEAITDGLHVQLRYTMLGGVPNYIPSFTLQHRTKDGKVLSEVKAGPQNYDKETQSYNLVFKNPGYKLGEEYQIYLKEADPIITNITMIIQYFQGENFVTEKTTLKKNNYLQFKIREVAYYEGDEGTADAKAIKGLEPSKDFPLSGEVSTDSSKVGFILTNKSGAPLKNEAITILTLDKKEYKLTSDQNGVAWIDKSKLTVDFLVESATKVFLDTSTNMTEQEAIEGEHDSILLSFYYQEVNDGIYTYPLTLLNKESNSDESAILGVDVKVDGNTELSSNWVTADLEFKDKEGVVTSFSLNEKDAEFILPNGTYTVTAKSPYANVKLSSNSVTIKNGKGSLSVTLSPKYILDVSKDGKPYQFQVVNVSSLQDKVFKGTKSIQYGVTPNESYMIQDNDSKAVYTVIIEEDSPLTKLILGLGVVFGGEVSTPHTGDSIIFFVILFFVLLIGAGVSFYISNKNKRLKNTVTTSLLVFFLLGSSLPTGLDFTNPQTVEAAGTIGSGTAGDTTTGTVSASGVVQTDKTVSVLMVSFTTGANADGKGGLHVDSSIHEMSDPNKFSNERLRNVFFIAPNEATYNIFKNSSFAVFDKTNGVTPIWGDTPFDWGTGKAAVENRKKYGIQGSLTDRLMPLPEDGSKISNMVINTVSLAFELQFAKPTSSRQLWKGESSSSEENIGDTINIAWDNILVESLEGIENPEEVMKIRSAQNREALNGYLRMLREPKVSQEDIAIQINERIQSAEKEGVADDYVFLFQVVQGFYVKGASPRKYTFMPMNDAVEWYIWGREKENPSKFKNANHMEEAKVIYGIPGDEGGYASSQWAKQAPTSTYVYNTRKTTGVAVKPQSSKVKIASGSTITKAALDANPFTGWGFTPWALTDPYVSAEPKLKLRVVMNVMDDNGKDTGKQVETYLHIPTSEAEGATGGSTEENARDPKEGVLLTDLGSAINTNVGITGSTTILVGTNQYTIPKQDDSYITLIDEGVNVKRYPKLGQESLLKRNQEYLFDLTTSLKGAESVVFPITDEESWTIRYSLHIPQPYQMQNYLGGNPEVKDDYNRYANLDVFSNALLTLYVDVYDDGKVCTKLKCEGDVATSTHTVPQWRLSKYFDDISPEDKVKARFNLTLPIGTYRSPRLSPKGNIKFNLIDPELDKTPWAISKAKLFDDDPIKRISLNITSARFNLAGDLLAVKDNISVSNVKLASWKNNYDLYNKRINPTNQGAVETASVVRKSHTFEYNVKSPYSEFEYSELRTRCSNGKCRSYRWEGEAKQSYIPSLYKVGVTFERYIPKESVAIKQFPKQDDKNTNGFYWESYQDKATLNVNPEVLMAFDDQNGNTSVVFAAGDRMRQIQPVHYNQARFVNVNIVPTVTGQSVATDSKAKQLASRLGSNGKQVIYKGSTVTNNFDIKGQLEFRTFALDIGSSALKNAWNNNSYNTNTIYEEYMSRYATKQADGTWLVNLGTGGKLKINNKDYGGQKDTYQLKQASKQIVEHTLVVRGGKLLSVDGVTDFSKLDENLRLAIERMKISTPVGDNIFNTFEREKGNPLGENKVADLGNAVRGTNDMKKGTNWYNEDTSVLVIREYITKFDLPQHNYVDKVPMSIPGLEAPIDMNMLFSKGYLGHTKLKFQVVDAWMEYDSSSKTPYGGDYSVDYIVPNASITDSFNQ